MTRKSLKILGCLAAALVATTAAADEAQLVEKVAVRNRLYSVAGRWELGANFGVSLLSKLTDSYNLNLGVAYNLVDWLAFEVRGGYALGGHSSTADDIQQKFATRTSSTSINDLSDMWQLGAHGILGVRFQPIYGKFNLVAELPVHFQLYVWAGGGVGSFDRTSVVLCGARTTVGCQPNGYITQSALKPIFSAALGFRFFAAEHHAIKVEVRDWSFPDSYYEGVNGSLLTGGGEVAIKAAGGQASTNAGLTNMVQVDFGYSYIF
jgi:outer membrane beta-barrel protein